LGVVAAPLVEAVRIAGSSHPQILAGDFPFLEMAARRAWQLDQLVGPYSRFGWHHPGPALFYLLALPVRLLEPSGPGIYLGAALINAVALAALVAFVWYRAGRWAAAATSIALVLFCLCLSTDFLRQPWNPFMVVIPLALGLLLAADASRGSTGSLVWSFVVFSYVIQTHISTAPVAALVGLAALAGWVYWRLVRREGRRSGRPGLVGIVVGSAAAVTIWIPPLVELFRDNPNNLTNLRLFFTQSHPTHTLHEAFHLSVGELTIVPFGNHVWAGQLSRGHWQEALAFLGIAIVASIALVVAYRRRQWLGMATTVFSLASFPIGVVATSRTVGDLMAYLAVWESVIPPMLLIGLAIAILGPDGRASPEEADAPPDADAQNRPPRRLGLVVTSMLTASVVVIALVAVRSDLQQPPVAALGDPTIVQLTASANRVLTPQDRWVDIDIVSHDSWGTASGLALDLERAGHRTTVSGAMDWTLLFGAERRPNGQESVRLSMYMQSDRAAAGQATGSVIGSVNGEVLTFTRLRG
jgi:hypothetical protein